MFDLSETQKPTQTPRSSILNIIDNPGGVDVYGIQNLYQKTVLIKFRFRKIEFFFEFWKDEWETSGDD